MRMFKILVKDGVAGALALGLAICAGSDAQAIAPMQRDARPRVVVSSLTSGLPAHLRGLDTSKITSRVFYQNTVAGGGARQGSQPFPDSRSMLLVGSGLMALGVLVRRLRASRDGANS